MDLLGSADWQRGIVRRFGPNWTDPHLASESYDHLILSAEVVGRDDVADALRQRLSPELFREEAPILQTLHLLAGDWLHTPLPVFSEPACNSPTWQELMEGLSDDSFEYSSTTSVDSSELQSEADSSDKSSFGEALPAGKPDIRDPTYIAPAIPDKLTARQVLDEAALIFSGYHSVLETVRDIQGLSSACSEAYINELMTQRKPLTGASTLLQCMAYWRKRPEGETSKNLRNFSGTLELSEPLSDTHESHVKAWKSRIIGNQVKMRTIRPLLLRDWYSLAGIYLGQNPRMLDYMWRCRHALIGGRRVPAAADLASTWPEAPFYLDNDCIPEMPSIRLETWEYVSKDSLNTAWRKILTAIASPPRLESAILQAEMHMTSIEVARVIEDIPSPQKVFT